MTENYTQNPQNVRVLGTPMTPQAINQLFWLTYDVIYERAHAGCIFSAFRCFHTRKCSFSNRSCKNYQHFPKLSQIVRNGKKS